MRIASTDGVELELHDLGGEGQPLLIAHATGFCGGAYKAMAPVLTVVHHVYAVDFRAHGESTAPASGDLTWRGMADDVLAVVDALGEGPVAGIGHSMGGAALVAAELRRPGILLAAYVYEPIIVPDAWPDAPRSNPMAQAARRRRPTFASRAEAFERFAPRPPLNVLRSDSLMAYIDHGFEPQADGSIALRCSPENEAQTFEADGKPKISELAAVRAPVLVAYGQQDPDGPQSFAPNVARGFERERTMVYPHLGHFGPLQDPTGVADDAIEFLTGAHD